MSQANTPAATNSSYLSAAKTIAKPAKKTQLFSAIIGAKNNQNMPAHLTEAQKTRALAKLEDNWSLSEVAADLNVSKSCIYYIKKRWQEQQRLRRPIRQGIGKVSNEQEDNALVEFIHQNPFKTATKAREETQFPGSVRTAQRRLKQSGLKNCAAARKVFLSNEHKQIRVQFANEMLNREHAFWNNVVFSDEKTFQSCGSGQIRVYRPRNSSGFLGQTEKVVYSQTMSFQLNPTAPQISYRQYYPDTVSQ
ncbi:hypothetical protein NQ315_012251 [Exocentrus adspersus]|uniref:Transposase Tc1-like domain-containing protein n=1 Tax=Exocentrus adspersus TaxID=1586481 RepID=A0AAV8VF99_9CUCU|nr:hypothetical protein NQ315_012251 [Exocentrus adspersus]